MKKIALIAALSGAAFTSQNTLAQDYNNQPTRVAAPTMNGQSMYGEFGIGRTTFANGSDKAFNLRAMLGTDLSRSFALEGGLNYFGSGNSYDAMALSAAGVLKHRFSPVITLTAKAGLDIGNVENGPLDDTGFDIFYGFSIIARVNRELNVYASWENHSFELGNNAIEIEPFNVGVHINF